MRVAKEQSMSSSKCALLGMTLIGNPVENNSLLTCLILHFLKQNNIEIQYWS
jgi:hypothetical protein